MFRRGKYVIGHIAGADYTAAILFDESVDHSLMARKVFGNFAAVKGAGFFSMGLSKGEHKTVTVKVYGRSSSLKMNADAVADIGPVQKALGLYDYDC